MTTPNTNLHDLLFDIVFSSIRGLVVGGLIGVILGSVVMAAIPSSFELAAPVVCDGEYVVGEKKILTSGRFGSGVASSAKVVCLDGDKTTDATDPAAIVLVMMFGVLGTIILTLGFFVQGRRKVRN